jgi:hypothetical protein
MTLACPYGISSSEVRPIGHVSIQRGLSIGDQSCFAKTCTSMRYKSSCFLGRGEPAEGTSMGSFLNGSTANQTDNHSYSPQILNMRIQLSIKSLKMYVPRFWSCDSPTDVTTFRRKGDRSILSISSPLRISHLRLY